MKKINTTKMNNDRPMRWTLNSAVSITLIFNQFITDPFNSPKFWLLMLCASLIFGYSLNKKLDLEIGDKNFYKIIKTLILAYLISSFISSIKSYNPQVSFLGENFRRNGLLTFISFTVFFIVTIKYINFKNLDIVLKRAIVVGTITALYSLMQITKKDFVKWSDPNAVITTLGNSNFAGAAMAIFAIICFGHLFIKSLSIYYRVFTSAIFLLLSYSILKTNARQAIYIIIVGIFIIALVKLFEVNKKLGRFILFSSIPISLLSILGMLQIGPLQNYLYKGTITIRGYYWRAGIEMFKANPLFGVGLDNYGAFFKQYREASYPLKYGFGITSTNAHNIFIQNFATGGIFVGSIYLLLQVLVLYKALLLIKNSRSDNRIKVTIIFAAWAAFQSQSLISIDNIGLSIWGWLFGGVILGLSFKTKAIVNSSNHQSNKSLNINWRIVTPSTVLVLSTILLIIPLYSGERYTLLTNTYNAPKNSDPKVKELFKLYSDKALDAKFINNDYRNIVITALFQMGYTNEALNQLLMINRSDPRNLDTLVLLATSYEQLSNYTDAIKYRKEIVKYDPWNAQNYLGLAQLYKRTNDPQNMMLMVDKILKFAGSDPIAEVAKKEFSQNSN